ncbi:rhodanese-like domain-containing protein [Vagococcus sp. BWB3-3]|uniref:Rhodanese-like domain-containing protein n=1 Tax=Vagococcus allomyrinae TaxID=2794353 RepID=A0A940P9A8_9ENTE|nr:rhodanese-like domain-containing protein [Vagococcus allomyrinae]MBP1043400.1 rhodanese-like domain-containing protein [Vagococcus allomyrinae]
MFLFNKVATISSAELATQLSQKPVIIDVREKDEFAGGHIPGAQNIPLGELERFNGQADKVYLVCQSGMRSKQGAALLNSKGYEAINLKHGMIGWNGPIQR